MSSLRHRRYVLGGLLAATGLLAAAVLWNVVTTVFFAITVAYVLYPARQRLVNRGFPRRIASGLLTAAAFFAVVVLFAPIAWTVFRRRGSILEFLHNLPDELPIEAFGFVATLDVADMVNTTANVLQSIAISLAADAIFIALQLIMFALVLYGLLLRPNAVGRAAFRVTPSAYHDILLSLHQRIAGTLYALYVIQAATAVITFPIALVVFYLLGYPDVFVLSVLAALLQFIPIVGPGMLAAALAGHDVLIGMPQRAVGVIVLGPLFVGLLPDLLIRPRLASSQAQLPASLYFVGFVGGVLTVGIIGIIAGPLVVALLVEAIELLGERGQPTG